MTNSTQVRRSAANIVLRPPAGPQRSDAVARMRRLMDACGTNKHDRVIAAIIACILDGIDTAGGIAAVLSAAGANVKHVRMMLSSNAGPDPIRHHWWKGADGRYARHPDVPDTAAA